MKPSIQYIPVASIMPDPEQPRKTFSDDSIRELAQSIEKSGLHQPITVRPKGDAFHIVMGERRFRAHLLLEKETVQCIVRDFGDTAALEAQIIENLQREDIPPLEEADAILSLRADREADDIALSIGRTIGYVHSRLKLARLIAPLRIFIADHRMPLKIGIKLALLPIEEQQALAEHMRDDYNGNFLKNAIDDNYNDLDKAPFDIDDQDLTKAGACTRCPFNSANQGMLFGENKSICSKAACYSIKRQEHFHGLIDAVKSDGRLLIPTIYGYNDHLDAHIAIISIMGNQGLTVWTMDDVEILMEPIEPSIATVKKKYGHHSLDEGRIRELLERDTEGYSKDRNVFDSAMDNGYVKGVRLNSKNYRTTDIMVKVRPVKDRRGPVPLDKKKMDQCTPLEKMEKIGKLADRKDHIENNKLFRDLADEITVSSYPKTRKPLTEDEMIAMSLNILNNHLDIALRKEFYRAIFGKSTKKDGTALVALFKKKFQKGIFYQLVRTMMLGQLRFGEANHLNDMVNHGFYIASRPFTEKTVAPIEARYSQEAILRRKKLDERLGELEKENEALRAGR